MSSTLRVRSALVRSLHRALGAVMVFALLLGLVQMALLPLDGPAGAWFIAMPAVLWAYVAAGLLAWERRPSNPMGFLILVAGLGVFVGSIASTGVPMLVAVGTVTATLVFPTTLHLLLAFPTGRLMSRTSRAIVVAAYAISIIGEAPRYLLDPAGPYPPFAIANAPDLLRVLVFLQSACGAVIMGLAAAVLVNRLLTAEHVHRRVLIPLFSYGVFAVAFVPFSSLILEGIFGVDPTVRFLMQLAVIAGVPLAFVLGILRGGFAKTGELEELGTWLGSAGTAKESLEAALARALGDPSLTLAFRSAHHNFVDAEGRPAPGLAGPDKRSGREEIVLDGRIIGAITYDAGLLPDPELVRTAGHVVAIAVERERLTAELHASRRAVLESRARLVDAADRERRRIARDLHDGLQVQLVMLALEAQQLALVPGTPDASVGRAIKLRSDIDEAARILRSLVHDLVPASLIERGLSAATEDLIDRMPMPTVLQLGVTDGELPDAVERTAYFVLTEALTNVVKHSGARSSRVSLLRTGDLLHIEVHDDGSGGASVESGTGLRGLADRVDVLGGVLRISSPAGGGTRLLVEVPCA